MTLNRRSFLCGLSAGLVAAPAVLSPSRALAALEGEAGRLLMIGFHGSSANARSARALAAHMKERRAGGVVFLGHNVKSRKGIDSLTDLFGSASRGGGLIAIDHEGGAVQRLKARHGFTRLPKALRVGHKRSSSEARALYAQAARELKAAGFTLNLAPVADLHWKRNPIIGRNGRAFSSDPAEVAAYAEAFVKAHRRNGVLCAVKHFPGHGLSRGDTHAGLVDITDSWSEAELEPFKALVRKGAADIVMSGHLYHRSLEDGGVPITFSRRALRGTLRTLLGFRGAIMTDDLDMGAIRKRYAQKEAVIRSLAAGNDLVLMTNSARPDKNLPKKAVRWISEAVENGRLNRRELSRSIDRVRALS
ncbi:glycoside hydrolase family 3 N-terminal domain-containing protein [Coralliovum pocilloporae]|uniref:glycoside hydrolase family 3 N-terminal domain-containing protein n=1 Tax=Coralliovum pocilloporae TaxID=3066369 RepID=UPI0033076A30